MKTTHAVIITFLASVFFSFHVFAEECGKKVINVTPPQGSYKQITVEETKKMKNYTPSDQYEVSIQLDSSHAEGDLTRNNKSLDTDVPKVIKVESVTPEAAKKDEKLYPLRST